MAITNALVGNNGNAPGEGFPERDWKLKIK
jgi:hypothetical protein